MPAPLRTRLAAVSSAALLLTGLSACSSQPEPRSDVGVQMFQWTWNAIATECTENLGPAGYGWVLTSPPQEHIVGEEWWTAYQPVSYQVSSRLGTREEFAEMVSTCRDAGVDVVADAVINHMTGQDSPGTGWAGSSYEHYTYPGLYTEEDFHHCGLTPNDDIVDYRDALQVQTCELVNLADLDTGSESVRATIRGYLEDLLSLGVAGFRIDAAKHISPEDLGAILAGLPEDTVIMQEVIGAAGEPIQPADYADLGQVFDFYFGRELNSFVGGGSPQLALDIGTSKTGLDSEQAIVFVDNHDTERNGSTYSYRDAERYQLATVLELALDYGTPVVLSSYAFGLAAADRGPDQDGAGAVLDASCPASVGPGETPTDGQWLCQHRWPATAGMVHWRAAVGDEPITEVTSGQGVLAFTRGDGFLALNAASVAREVSAPTALSDGSYCDLLTGGMDDGGACVGTEVTVSQGEVRLTLEPYTAVALLADEKS